MAKKVKTTKAAKLPKSVAGVKLPKSVRRAGSSLTGLIDSDAGRAALGAALVAAGQSLIGNRSGTDAGSKAGVGLGGVASAAATVVGEVARQVLAPASGGEAEPDAKPRRGSAKTASAFTAPTPEDGTRKRRDKH